MQWGRQHQLAKVVKNPSRKINQNCVYLRVPVALFLLSVSYHCQASAEAIDRRTTYRQTVLELLEDSE